jgi:hypothetical protein
MNALQIFSLTMVVGSVKPTQLVSVFFVSIRYMVVKIVCSSSEVVLRTTKHTVIYSDLGPSLEVIALRPVD